MIKRKVFSIPFMHSLCTSLKANKWNSELQFNRKTKIKAENTDLNWQDKTWRLVGQGGGRSPTKWWLQSCWSDCCSSVEVVILYKDLVFLWKSSGDYVALVLWEYSKYGCSGVPKLIPYPGRNACFTPWAELLTMKWCHFIGHAVSLDDPLPEELHILHCYCLSSFFSQCI